MNWTAQQTAALNAVTRWLANGEQVFRLFGYAGTGKTTLARHVHADLYAAYTGKAAHVMKQKGCPATTIHSLVYLPRAKSQERLVRLLAQPRTAELEAEIERERQNLQTPSFTLNLDSPLRYAKLLVIDECSMVDDRMARDLLSFGKKILVLGDPAQLPPVYGNGYFTNTKPDFLLTQVHRQARDNPILELATIVREEQYIPATHPLIRWGLTDHDVKSVDQIIVGRNRTRHASNRRLRQILGYAGPPNVGERVVCTRNNHFIGILNGATYTITAIADNQLQLDNDLWVTVHPELFDNEPPDPSRMAEHFEYGYALTCHKAQGSQWPSVGIVNECDAFGVNRWRWLYTAITRAAENLWVLEGR